MRYEFQPPGEIRGGPSFYDPEGRVVRGPVVPFGSSLASRPDRAPELPIPPARRVLDLGCGAHKEAGSVGVDLAKVAGVDVRADLFRPPVPFRTASIDLAYAHEFLEHIPHRLDRRGNDGFFVIMQEIHRVLKPGGIFRLDVPHAQYQATWIDPTHTRGFLPQSFNYLEPENALGFYSPAKFRVLALRIEWVHVKRRWKDYHLKKHLRSEGLRRFVGGFLAPEPGYLHVILQRLPGPGDSAVPPKASP